MNLVEKDLKYIWHPCSQMKDYETFKPIVIQKGLGAKIYDIDGNSYIDIVSSWWCNLLGHCNPSINKKIKKQLDTLEHVIFANFTHKSVIELCDKLVKFLPSGLNKFNFSDNGSASVECALKMSFQYFYQINKPEKNKFASFSDGYHGETVGALSVGSMDLYSKIYKPMLIDSIKIQSPDCYRCEFGKSRENCSCECFYHAETVFKKHGHEMCSMIVEPLLQGAAGMKVYPSLYLQKLRKLCDKYQVLLIADEIATGFGRCGTMFACNKANISPDIMCISKGLTGGYMPMAITITTEKIYKAFYDDYNTGRAFMHSHTYSGNPLACSAALAVLDILEKENIISLSIKMSKYLNKEFNRKFSNNKYIGEIRHINLIHAIELVEDKFSKKSFDPKLRIGYQIYQCALKKGLLLRPLGDVLYFNPPLNISKEELDTAIEICDEAIYEVLSKKSQC